MQPIHLAIGVVEGFVTGTVVLIVWRARPELIEEQAERRSLRPILVGLGVTALVTGGVLSWFASAHPDGLEWSVARTTGSELAPPSGVVHRWLARVQRTTAFLPDYAFKSSEGETKGDAAPAWPAPSAGTSTSGVIGSLLVLGIAAAIGYGIRLCRRRGRE